MCILGEDIFIIGGSDDDEKCVNNVIQYKIGTRQVSEVSCLHTSR